MHFKCDYVPKKKIKTDLVARYSARRVFLVQQTNLMKICWTEIKIKNVASVIWAAIIHTTDMVGPVFYSYCGFPFIGKHNTFFIPAILISFKKGKICWTETNNKPFLTANWANIQQLIDSVGPHLFHNHNFNSIRRQSLSFSS